MAADPTPPLQTQPSTAAIRSSEWFCGLTTEQIGKLANDEALQWDTLWPNHDPSFLNACRSAFADGFMRGFQVRDDMPQNDQADPQPGQRANETKGTQ